MNSQRQKDWEMTVFGSLPVLGGSFSFTTGFEIRPEVW